MQLTKTGLARWPIVNARNAPSGCLSRYARNCSSGNWLIVDGTPHPGWLHELVAMLGCAEADAPITLIMSARVVTNKMRAPNLVIIADSFISNDEDESAFTTATKNLAQVRCLLSCVSECGTLLSPCQVVCQHVISPYCHRANARKVMHMDTLPDLAITPLVCEVALDFLLRHQ